MSAPRKKSKGVTGPTFSGEFSWVNKDATNIARRDHSTTVARHVSTRYEKWKKTEKAKKSNVATGSPENCLGSGRIEEEDFGALRDPITSPHHTNWNDQPSSRDAQYPVTHNDADKEWPLDISQYTTMSSNHNFEFGSNVSVDPIQKSPVDVDEKRLTSQHAFSIDRLLDFAQNVVCPTVWPSVNGNNEWEFELSSAMNDFKDVQDCPVYASTSAYFFGNMLYTGSRDQKILQQLSVYREAALAALNSGSVQSIHTFLKARLRIFTAETMQENNAIAREHLRSLRTTVVAHGGILVLDPWLQQNLLSADTYFALSYGTRPQFRAIDWRQGTLKHPMLDIAVNNQVKMRSRPKIHLTVENVALRSTMEDLRDLLDMHAYFQSKGANMDNQLSHWSHLQRLNALSRLADHRVNVNLFPHQFLLPKFQLAICTSIALMTAMVLGSPEPVRFGLKLLSDLQSEFVEARREFQSMKQFDSRDVEFYQCAFVWVAYVGMLGSQVHPVPNAEWFSDCLRMTMTEPGLKEAVDLKSVVVQFLYSKSLEDEILSGQPHREESVMNGYYESCGLSWRQPVLQQPMTIEATADTTKTWSESQKTDGRS